MKNAFLSMMLMGCLTQFAAAQGGVMATHSAAGYIAGNPGATTVIITNVFTYPVTNTLKALYLTNALPPGWKMSQNTWGPGTREVHTNFNELAFVGVMPTDNPLIFSYEVDVPPNQTGVHYISSVMGYRFDEQADAEEIPVTPVKLALKMRVSVAADPAGKVYGQADPPLTYTVTAGEPLPGDVFTGALARVVGENVGIYEIQQGTLGINDNYIISYTPNVFEITQLRVQAGGTRVYDGTTKANFSILDVINKVGADKVDFVSGFGTLTSPNVGVRAIANFGTLALGGAQAANYTLTGATGEVKITAVAPAITTHPQSVTAIICTAAGFIVRAKGTPPLAYQWQKDGVNIPGATSSNYNIAVLARHHDGNKYRCRVSSPYGAVTSREAVLTVRRVINDFDCDGKSDGAIIQNTATWKILYSSNGYASGINWDSGLVGWIPVPGDYDGDFRTDAGMYNPANGMWHVYLNTTPPTFMSAQFGSPGELPVQADYDGDKKTDPCLYNPQTGGWRGLKSSQNYAYWVIPITLGGPGFKPVPDDYDGDGKADPAVYSPATGKWRGAMSSDKYEFAETLIPFGTKDDLPTPMDYDGDGKADPGIYNRNTGLWQVLMSSQGYALVKAVLGIPYAVPIVADYDRDGKADPALYQVTSGYWLVYLSSQNYATISGYFGGSQYMPITESVAGRQ